MDRLTVTTIENLQIGDRFLKQKDKKKEVWQKVAAEKKSTYFQTYSHFAIKDGDRFNTAFKKDTQVIFLRHQINEVKTKADETFSNNQH